MRVVLLHFNLLLLVHAHMAGFPINLEILKIVEILPPDQKADLAQIVKVNSTTSSSQGTLEENKCKLHCGMLPEFFCGECTVLVCGKCMLSEHRLHKDVKYATNALSEHISSLTSMLAPIDTIFPEIEDLLKSLQSNVIKIHHSGEKAALVVKNYFSDIQQILNEREKEILEAVKSEVNRKEDILSKQQNSIKKSIDHLQKCVAVIQDVSKSNEGDVLFLLDKQWSKFNIETHLDSLESYLKTSHQGVKVTFQKPFDFKSNFKTFCMYLGEKKSRETQLLMDTMYPSRKSSHTNQLHRSSSIENMFTQSHSYVKLRHASIDSTCATLFQTRSPSLESISMDADLPSALILSPFLEISAKELRGSGQLLGPVHPYGVCVGKPDCLIVTDSQNCTFSILTPTGKCLESIALEKKREWHSKDLRAVTTDENGNILIVDGGTTSMIRKYSAAGE